MVLRYLAIVILWASAASAQNKCCGGLKNLLGDHGCKDGSNITGILCPRKYMLRGETTDTFFVDSHGNLVEDGAPPIPLSEYCLTKETEDGEDVALVCFSDQNNPSESEGIFLFRAACAVISVLFLTATVIVYIVVPSLRDLQGKCLLHSVTALAMAMLMLCIMQFGVIMPYPICEIIGYLTFALFLATFTWLNVISFHIWRTTVLPTAMGTNKQWYLLYCLYAYGLPGIITLTAIIGHHAPGGHVKPGIGTANCWFATEEAKWAYFYGPIACLLVLNVIFFFWTVKKLWKDIRGANSTTKIKSLRYKCLLYIKLFFIMGLSWIFEVLSFAFDDEESVLHYVWMIADFINALQGVLIFLILVVFRKRALRGLAGRGLCCISLPPQWKSLHDEEVDEVAEEEQLARNNLPEEHTYKTKEDRSAA